jgi:aryl-alcohol dehydrogenase-like predicted oxidoreductase
MSLTENQRKLDLVDQLEQLAQDAGVSLIHLALGFVLAHRSVTSAIIGPRTLEQLEGQLGAQELRLAADVLDRIDAIVPPGTTLNEADAGWRPPWLDSASQRRR